MMGFFTTLLIIAGLSLLIIFHEAGHFFAAKLSGILVEEFGFGLPPKIFARRFGETLISFNWLPFGGFVRVYGERHDEEKSDIPVDRSFSHKPAFVRAAVIAAGVMMNFILGWWLLTAVLMIGIPQSLLVTEVKPGSIADASGIIKGDQIFGFKSFPEFSQFLNNSEGGEISLKIVRDGKRSDMKIDLVNSREEDRGKLGVYIVESGTEPHGFFRALITGFTEALKICRQIFSGIGDLLVGLFTDWSVFGSFAGPVGIFNIAAQTAKTGIVNFLQLLAFISLNLAVFNILPVPALDGGRLLFLLIEKISGEKISPRKEALAQAVSFTILLILILGVTIQDILRLL